MNENLQSSINNIFGAKPSSNQKAWGIINQFYHLVLTKMEEDNITRADLARILGKSRAAISQMFNKSPNISIRKMIEIADAVNLEMNLTTDIFQQDKQTQMIHQYVLIPANKFEKESIDNKCKITRLDNNKNYSHTEECSSF